MVWFMVYALNMYNDVQNWQSIEKYIVLPERMCVVFSVSHILCLFINFGIHGVSYVHFIYVIFWLAIALCSWYTACNYLFIIYPVYTLRTRHSKDNGHQSPSAVSVCQVWWRIYAVTLSICLYTCTPFPDTEACRLDLLYTIISNLQGNHFHIEILCI